MQFAFEGLCCVNIFELFLFKCQNMHSCTILKGRTKRQIISVSSKSVLTSKLTHYIKPVWMFMFSGFCPLVHFLKLYLWTTNSNTSAHTPCCSWYSTAHISHQSRAGKLRLWLKCFSCSCSPGRQSELLRNMFFTPGS